MGTVLEDTHETQYEAFRPRATTFKSIDHLCFVRLPRAWLPSFLHKRKCLEYTLLSFWPAMGYATLGDLISDASTNADAYDKAKLVRQHENENAPDGPHARLLGWTWRIDDSEADDLRNSRFSCGRRLDVVTIQNDRGGELTNILFSVDGDAIDFSVWVSQVQLACARVLEGKMAPIDVDVDLDDGGAHSIVVEETERKWAQHLLHAMDVGLNCFAMDEKGEVLPDRTSVTSV